MIPPRPMTAREFSVPIVQRFYRESLGDIDLTMMIEQALLEFASQKAEAALREAARIIYEEPYDCYGLCAEKVLSVIPKDSQGRKA